MPTSNSRIRRPAANKSAPNRNHETAAQFARRAIAQLAPRSINDLIRKVQDRTKKRMQWERARDIFKAFAAEEAPQPTRKRARSAPNSSPAAASSASRATAVHHPELFLLLIGKRGRPSETIETTSRADAERRALECIAKGQSVRIFKATEAKLTIQLT